ncbi:hypothetical protein ACSSS7_001576 [Eimeria intestinalis]
MAPLLRGASKGKLCPYRMHVRSALGVFASITAILLLIGVCMSALKKSAGARRIGRVLSAKKGFPESGAPAFCESEVIDLTAEEEDPAEDVPPEAKRARVETGAAEAEVPSGKEDAVPNQPPPPRKKVLLREWERESAPATSQGGIRVPPQGGTPPPEQEAAPSTSEAGVPGSRPAVIQGVGALPVARDPSTTEDLSASSPTFIQAEQRPAHTTSSVLGESSQQPLSGGEAEVAHSLLMLVSQEAFQVVQSSSAPQLPVGPASTTSLYTLLRAPLRALTVVPPALSGQDQLFGTRSAVPALSAAPLPAAPLVRSVHVGGQRRPYRPIAMRPVESTSTATENLTQQSLSQPSTSGYPRLDPTAQVSDGREHPFSRVPYVQPSDQAKRRFNPRRALYEGLPSHYVPGGLFRLRALLTRQSLGGGDLDQVAALLEEVVGYVYFRETRSCEDNHPSVAVRNLGRRLVLLDIIVAALQVLGEPLPAPWWVDFVDGIPIVTRQSIRQPDRNSVENQNLSMLEKITAALQILKTGVRPPKKDLVDIKKFLFTSPHGPYCFKKPRWDGWRADDDDFERQQREGSRGAS